jgi:hypothetical protein
MSQIKTQPVLFCKRCGRPMTLKRLATTVPDEGGELLHQFMQNIGKISLCGPCRRAKNYYIAQGRLEDFEAGRP